jgi:hypothetical protein
LPLTHFELASAHAVREVSIFILLHVHLQLSQHSLEIIFSPLCYLGFFFLCNWGLNSGLHTCKAGILPPVHFALVILELGVSRSICLCWPQPSILLISASQIDRITGVCPATSEHFYRASAQTYEGFQKAENWASDHTVLQKSGVRARTVNVSQCKGNNTDRNKMQSSSWNAIRS